jgi:hypothetical protein
VLVVGLVLLARYRRKRRDKPEVKEEAESVTV